MRAAGSSYAVFQRALKHGNLWVAEAEAREMRRVPLEDALKLVHLYAEKESPKYERAAMKWPSGYVGATRNDSPLQRVPFADTSPTCVSPQDD